MVRGALSLIDPDSGEIYIEEGLGLSPRQLELGRYKLGEGVTGNVVATGQAMVIPRVSEEPLFLNKTHARNLAKDEVSFICVPVKTGNTVIGTLSVDRLFADTVTLDEDMRLLTIIASMIARSVQLRLDAQKERRRLLEENTRLQEALQERFRPDNIIGNSSAMQAVYDMIAQVANSDTTVLIRGESGVGKELVAHAIHYNSHRAAKPFIRVNCAALPESVIESELFGHEKGAFTGAIAQRKGRFELARGGTIFLDEIGDLSPTTQVKLLRVLQEKEFERVGGSETLKTDVRVLAATNRELEELMRQRLFREDLYYRLNVFPIHIPPLRERRTDILLLADYFVDKYCRASNKSIKRISTAAVDMLARYHWPGNVRELENCIERAVVLSNDEVLHGHHLPPTVQTAEATGTEPSGRLEERVDSVEREMILDALKSTRGNELEAAESLGVSEEIIGSLILKHNIRLHDFRSPAILRAEAEPADDEYPPMLQGGGSLQNKLERYERTLIAQALKASRGNRAKAAKMLGITERIMGLRVVYYGINAKSFKSGGPA
jgi:Nif-specific regulatory protein